MNLPYSHFWSETGEPLMYYLVIVDIEYDYDEATLKGSDIFISDKPLDEGALSKEYMEYTNKRVERYGKKNKSSYLYRYVSYFEWLKKRKGLKQISPKHITTV